MIRFTSLGSGSEGNALLIEAGGPRGTRLMIDCGLPVRQALARIEARGIDPKGLDEIGRAHV